MRKGILMSGKNENGLFSLTAAAALTAFTGIKIDSNGQAAVAGLGEVHDGIVENNVASGGAAMIRLRTAPGTRKVTVASSCSIGSYLYAAASGKVSTTKSGPALYMALQAATGDGSIVEVLPLPGRDNDVSEVYKVADATDQSNGYVDFTHGLGAAPTFYLIQAFNGSTGAPRVLATAVADSTKVRATITSLAANDVVCARIRR